MWTVRKPLRSEFKRLNIEMHKQFHAEIKAIAARENRSISSWVMEAIVDKINSKKAKGC